ncbi:SusC/RagA family TonB-linked outer membrane protein [Prevotella sp. 10(H)]|uniref:SusC/RagA family TonB-linked outer membrane protein n=1 Tax=Prevotella sp. 10(H) TaxID=1158294 RepID=UPI0009E017F0|nr:SusC/RagA family TonB-linked outer membrane protein [Prevotella sp. 10(H)]
MMKKKLTLSLGQSGIWVMIRRTCIFLALFTISSYTSMFAENLPAELGIVQQTSKVTGHVKDSNGDPLVGVVVQIKGTNTATTTDADGQYEITAPADATLIFSYVGFVKQEIAINNRKEILVTMVDNNTLDEVVVMGYTTQRRRDVSASVAKIDMKSIEQNPTASLSTLLAGQAPGLQTVIRSGIPGGAGGGLVIRGNTSLSSSDGLGGLSNPLYIVDGVPMSLQDVAGFGATMNDYLSSLNPNDIQSIDILKDAAATAIYGSRGANGVIIVTTKKGTSGKARVNASVTLGVITTPEKMEVYIGEAERQEKLNYFKRTLTNLFGEQAWVDVRNGYEIMGYALPSVLTDKYNPAFNNAYDFQDMFYRSGFTQNYDVSIDGGGESNSYRVGIGHYKEDGVLVGYGFSRTSINASLINDINKYFHNEFQMRYSYLDRKGGLKESLSNSEKNFLKAMPSSPTNLPSSLFSRTTEELDRMSGELGEIYNKDKTHDLTISDALRINFSENLSLNSQASLSLLFTNNDYFIPSTARSDNKSFANSESSTMSTVLANTVLNYYKDFGEDHSIVGLLAAEINTNTQQRTWTEVFDGPSDYMKVIQGYKSENTKGFSNKVTTNMLSYFGMLSYGYKENRYKVEGVVRRDASSRFGANNKWATFPSVKVHWAFSKEPWMEGLSSWLDFGKLRFSWGKSGSVDGDPLLQYNSLEPISNIGAGMYDFYKNKMDVKTYGGKSLLVSNFDRVANKDLSWNKSKELNYGIDLELFNRRLFITGDIYSKYLAGLVYTSNLAPYVGYNSLRSNLVDMVNNGFELGITGYLFPRQSDFQWEWTLNLAKNKSKVAKLGNGGRDYISGDYAFVVGRPAFQYYTYEYAGTLDSFDDLPVNPMTGEAMKYLWGDAGLALGLQGRIFPGMPLFTDVNGDYMIDAGDYGNDKKIIDDKSPEPKVMGGLHTTIRFKNLSLRVQSSFAFGHHIFNTTLQEQLTKFDNIDQFFNSALYKFDSKKFWERPGDGSYYPMIYLGYSDGGSVRAFRRSSMFIEKGDYWSLDNITLSYNLPDKYVSKIGLRGVNVYGTARNVCMWKESGVFDPRQVSKLGYYNGSGYPLSSTFLFGIQFQY